MSRLFLPARCFLRRGAQDSTVKAAAEEEGGGAAEEAGKGAGRGGCRQARAVYTRVSSCCAYIVEQALKPGRAILGDVPQAQVVARGRKQVRVRTRLIRHPHDLSGGVGVVELARLDEGLLLLVELHDADGVCVLLLKGADGQPEALVRTH
eukprot:CAMPEP_0179917062 /NCGR_PEP_ID=MMETSP0983-20121128/2607_1 /TAXON_ID=483367 /ORGANISM="non described non described, Strain CCMP 2436" /LENGTH=150 /DNA_ID=CAMNT_0021819721 /DNA_START=574 /DNA_END=1027 /DNA_ORIENTATION=-